MNGLPLRPLAPDADALLMMPRSASFCELKSDSANECSAAEH